MSSSSLRPVSTGICNSNEVGKSPAFQAAMRCGADAMWRCDGDATAMPPRRRCDRAETGAETGAVYAQDRFKIHAELRHNTDKIQTSYMQTQTCMYELVSFQSIQTSYRLNTDTILFLGKSNTYTIQANTCTFCFVCIGYRHVCM